MRETKKETNFYPLEWNLLIFIFIFIMFVSTSNHSYPVTLSEKKNSSLTNALVFRACF